MGKLHRRYIKINGLLEASPFFATKKQADDWYGARRLERDKVKSGKKSGNVPTFLEFSAQWMKRLIADYEKPTWAGYESNLRLHLLSDLKDYRMDEISRAKCREVLMNVTRNGYSVNHRKHVQATLSKIFTDAMNTEPPIVDANPVYRMKFDGKRQVSSFIPTFLETEEQVAKFLSAAKDISDLHFILVCLGLMSALRRSELIALKWINIRWHTNEIRVSSRHRAAMNAITSGTKSGINAYRDIPVSQTLLDVLKAYRSRTKFSDDDDFILTKDDGTHFRPGSFQKRFVEVRDKAKRPDLTIHSMRHTYGRLFAAKTGNTKALQSIFGHSSQAMTGKYSELTSIQMKPLAETMSFKISDTRNTSDTKTTQKRNNKRKKSTC